MKLILGAVAAAAVVFAGILGNELSKNIAYAFTRSGSKPRSKPKLIWALFFVSAAVGVTLSTWIALAPCHLAVSVLRAKEGAYLSADD